MANLARTAPSALAPAQSLRDVLRSCDPDAPLASNDPRWEDFAPARGDQAIEALGRELAWRAEDRFVHAAFVSHRGAGKSTEILRLTERLKDSYETVYLEATIEMDPFHIEAEDLLLNLAFAIEAAMEARGTPLPSELLGRIRGWFDEVIRKTSWAAGFHGEAMGGVEAKVGVPFSANLVGSLKALFKQESEYRTEVKQVLRSKPDQAYDSFDGPGRDLMEQALAHRINLDVVIPEKAARDLLISSSGGAIRELLDLVSQPALLARGEVITEADAERAVVKRRQRLRDLINANGWMPTLVTIARDKQISADPKAFEVLFRYLAFKYNGDGWYDVHPSSPRSRSSSVSAAATPASPQDSSAPERILGDDGGRAYRRFLAWTVGDGFAMAVIEVRSPAQRRELLAWTAAEMPGTRVVALDQASGKPLWPLLEQACPSPGGADILVLTRLEDAAERIKLCARINIQRDELVRAFPVPWVVLIHPAAALEMQQHAPDFSDFAGLWLNEEREDGSTHLEAFEQLGLESLSFAAPTMPLSVDDASSSLLGSALNAVVLSKYDEAVDLLAQYDMRYPNARAHEPQRIRVEALLLWMRGKPLEALSRFEEARRQRDPATNRLTHAGILGDIARIRAQQGDVDAALALHNEALQVYEALGDRRSRAGTLGDTARLRADKGEVEAALALHNEELHIYEELGDRRSRAVALGDIARLHADRGEVDDALLLHREQLKVNEELSDPIGIANARWSIGRMALRQGDGDAAFEHLSTAYAICNRIGRLDAICFVGIDLAQLLVATGHNAEAIPILTRSRDGFLHLGRPEHAQHTQKLIDSATDDS